MFLTMNKGLEGGSDIKDWKNDWVESSVEFHNGDLLMGKDGESLAGINVVIDNIIRW